MPTYFFILGRNPELSLAELHALLPVKYALRAFSREAAIVECAELEVETLMRRLGGTIKMGEILQACHFDQASGASARRNLTPLLLEVVGSLDCARDDEKRKKLFLGLSAYALNNTAKLPSVRELRNLGIEIKRALQTPSSSPPSQGGEKRSVRLVTSKEIALSSVIVKKEKLLTRGAEIVLFYGAKIESLISNLSARGGSASGGQYPIVGKTLAVQEFEEASARDFGRPAREMKVGLLPLQLAKIMINLARAPLDATILDPFCGFGTVLMEASQMGYTNLIGTDLEQKMVDATRKNLEWLQAKFTVNSSQSTAKLITAPVEQLSKHLPPRSVDAIVTEPYLGPTRETRDSRFEIRDLVDLYINAFREFAKILKPNARVVFIMPSFKSGATLTKTSAHVLPEIKKLRFQPIPLLPNNLITQSLNNSVSITYSRPDQRVLREIFVFEYKK
ncbi:hypothetical protein HYW17_02765 [Candidatus Uhrbacteria bacterium]|nr:hypothetical protein [Candidatus Uhrbacteria bacterium]